MSSSCQRQLPREALGYEVSVFSCGKAPGFSLVKIQTKGAESRQKKKSRPSRARKGSALKSEMASVEKRIFLRWTGLERTEGSAHTPNIEQKKEGMKKEQVKGCGSVNRPTPGSQRPAEPVASGFSPGVNSPFSLGQFWSLGVKPWVREQENPGIPGNIRGSNCGFGPKSEGEKAYDRTEIPCARKA